MRSPETSKTQFSRSSWLKVRIPSLRSCMAIRELAAGFDLAAIGCDMVTAHTTRLPKSHSAVLRYVHSGMFREYARPGEGPGVAHMYPVPPIRSCGTAALFAGVAKGEA